MLDFLFSLGFSKAICAATIGKTIDIMHNEVEANTELGVKVLDAVRNDNAPYNVDKENYETKLQDWIETQAKALHREKTKAMLTPFRTIATLF